VEREEKGLLLAAELQVVGAGEPDFGSLYNFPPASRMSMIARARLTPGGVRQVGFLPVYINRGAQSERVGASDPRFDEIVRYMEEGSSSQGLRVRYEPQGDLVLVHDASGDRDADVEP